MSSYLPVFQIISDTFEKKKIFFPCLQQNIQHIVTEPVREQPYEHQRCSISSVTMLFWVQAYTHPHMLYYTIA